MTSPVTQKLATLTAGQTYYATDLLSVDWSQIGGGQIEFDRDGNIQGGGTSTAVMGHDYSFYSYQTYAEYQTASGSSTPNFANGGLFSNVYWVVPANATTFSISAIFPDSGGWEYPTFSWTLKAADHLPTGSVTIAGTPVAGNTLTAVTSTIQDADGLGTFHYQWKRSADNGATWQNVGSDQATYLLSNLDVGDAVEVNVTYVDGASNAESLTSNPTSAVLVAPDHWIAGTGNWNTVADWDLGVPISVSPVVITGSNANVTLSQNATVDDLTVKASNTLTIGSGDSLTITSSSLGALQVDSGAQVILQSGASLTTNGTAIGTGTIIINGGATLELNGATAGLTIQFAGTGGTLKIDQPKSFAGTISNISAGDNIVLANTNITSGANYYYATIKNGGAPTLEVLSGTMYWRSPYYGLGNYVGMGGNDVMKPAAFKASYSLAGSNLSGEFFKAAFDGTNTKLTLASGDPIYEAMNGPANHSLAVSGAGLPVANIQLSATGVKVGVISGKTSTGDEGQAMEAIMARIENVAASGLNFVVDDIVGPSQLAAAIQQLQSEGCSIIVDDWSAIADAEPTINAAIDAAVSEGVTYFTSAGNRGLAYFNQIVGHKLDDNAIAVGAINWLNTPFGNLGQFQNDAFSSVGTAGLKPNVSAPDGASTGVAGFDPFFGTSAAAPAAAAVGAVMFNANPTLTPQEIAKWLEISALPFGNPAVSGDGLIRMDQAVLDVLTVWNPFYTAQGAQSGLAISSAAVSRQRDMNNGATVRIVLRMNEPVASVDVSNGLPFLTLNDGGNAYYDAGLSNLATGQLVFNYKVGAESTPDLKIVGLTTPLGSSPRDPAGNTANFSAIYNVSTGLSINSPLTASVSSSQTGEVASGQAIHLSLQLTEVANGSGSFSVNTAGGAPTLTLNDGATAAYDAALSNPATGKLVFDYTVGAQDSSSDLAISQVNLPTGTTIRDANGNNADFSSAIGSGTGLQIGPTSVDFIAASAGEANTGQTTQLSLQLSAAATINTTAGAPKLTLSNGATASYDAAASNLAAGNLVFDYTVGASDLGANLTATYNANGAVLTDSHGVAVVVSAVTNAPTGLTVNSPLKVTSIVPSPSTGSESTGQTVLFSVTMNETTSVDTTNGVPTLSLNDGGTATFTGGDGTSVLTFSYTVGSADTSVTGLAVTGISLNGAFVTDAAGNNADLSGALATFSGLNINHIDVPPVVAVSNINLAKGQSSIAASSLFTTTDPNGYAITKYALWDNGAGGGHFIVNGAVQANGAEIDLTAAQFAQTVYQAGSGPDELWVADYDGKLWSGTASSKWSAGFTVAPYVPGVVGLAVTSNTAATSGQIFNLSSLLTITDPDSVGYQKLELWEGAGTSGAGQFVVNGAPQTSGHEIDLTPANVGSTVFDARTVGGTDSLWAQLQRNDGSLTGWQPFSVTVANPTLSVTSSTTATHSQAIGLGNLVSIVDTGHVGFQKLELWDSNGTPGGGQLVVNGTAQTGGHEIDIAPANVANTVFDVGTLGGTDTLWAQLLQNDGTVTGWKQFAVTAPKVSPPTISVTSNGSATRGHPLALSSLVGISDPNGVGYQKLELWDSNGTVGGGQLVVNGAPQTGGHEIDIAPTDFANTVFDVGTLGGTDTLWAQLAQSDGTLSGWKQFSVTAPKPSLPTFSVTSNGSATRGQPLALSSLVTISDPDSVGYQKLELWDSSGTPGGGHFVVNGQAQTGGHEIDIAPADVANTVFDVGTLGGTDTMWAQLQQSDGTVTGWKQFSVTAPTIAPPTLSVASNGSASRSQALVLTSLVTITDPNAVGYQKLELWDSKGTPQGGQFVVNGAAQTGGHEIDVLPADVANTVFDVGSLGGTDTLWAQLAQSDGTVSGWKQFSVTAPQLIQPTLSVTSDNAAVNGQTLALSNLVTISDPSALGYQKLELWDDTSATANGQFVVNGVAQSAGHEIDLAPGDIANTVFDVSTHGGTNTLWARLLQNDGSVTSWKGFSVTAAAPTGPIISGPVAASGAKGSGTFTVNLLQDATDNSTMHVANLVWTDTGSGLPAGFTLSADGNSMLVDTNSLAYASLTATFSTHFAYGVVDSFGLQAQETATIAITPA